MVRARGGSKLRSRKPEDRDTPKKEVKVAKGILARRPGLGLAFHLWWCKKHGINPLTAEPKECYYELRGGEG